MKSKKYSTKFVGYNVIFDDIGYTMAQQISSTLDSSTKYI